MTVNRWPLLRTDSGILVTTSGYGQPATGSYQASRWSSLARLPTTLLALVAVHAPIEARSSSRSPFVTVGELNQWTSLHRWGSQRRAGLRAFIASAVVLTASFQAATVWGRNPITSPGFAGGHGRSTSRGSPPATPPGSCPRLLNIKDHANLAEQEGLELIR